MGLVRKTFWSCTSTGKDDCSPNSIMLAQHTWRRWEPTCSQSPRSGVRCAAGTSSMLASWLDGRPALPACHGTLTATLPTEPTHESAACTYLAHHLLLTQVNIPCRGRLVQHCCRLQRSNAGMRPACPALQADGTECRGLSRDGAIRETSVHKTAQGQATAVACLKQLRTFLPACILPAAWPKLATWVSSPAPGRAQQA